MGILLSDIIRAFEGEIPLSYQEPWDKSGLQVGSLHQKVRGVMFSLDATLEVLDQAIRKKADLLVTHHPLFLKDLKSFELDSYEGQILRKAIQNNIAIYTSHTNHDASPYSLNRHYAEKLKLKNIKPLSPTTRQPYSKLMVYVPEKHTGKVLDAIFKAGGGHIGAYSSCSFRVKGTGTFKGDETSHPFLGKRNQLESVAENKVEVLIDTAEAPRIVAAMLKAHPYEEVAYDLMPLQNSPINVGLGICGELTQAMPFELFLASVKALFKVRTVKCVGNTKKKIKSVGLCTGSGSSLLRDALRQGLDAFLTGDVKYHTAQEAERRGIVLLDMGHFASEVRSVSLLKGLFQRLFKGQLALHDATGLKDPFVYR